MPTSSRRPLILDTDGGVDDCTALWWAVTDPSIDLLVRHHHQRRRLPNHGC